MKNEKGAITLVTLATVIFILVFLVSSFVIISNKLQAQTEIKKELKSLYESEVRQAEEIYNSYYKIKYIEYLESTGTQYIDTGITANQDTSIEIVAQTTADISDATNGAGFIVYGAASSYNLNAFECYIHSSSYEFNYDGQYAFVATANTDENVTIAHDKNNVTLTIGETQYTQAFEYQAFTTPYTITLFGINRGEIIAAKAKIYSCKIYDNGILVRDFKPALDGNNIPCLYDEVTSAFFYNAGTGEFQYPT